MKKLLSVAMISVFVCGVSSAHAFRAMLKPGIDKYIEQAKNEWVKINEPSLATSNDMAIYVIARYFDDAAYVEKIKNLKGDLNSPSLIDSNNGKYPLHAAFENGNFTMAQALLQHGARATVLDRNKEMPIMYVARNQDIADNDCATYLGVLIAYKTGQLEKAHAALIKHCSRRPESLKTVICGIATQDTGVFPKQLLALAQKSKAFNDIKIQCHK